MIKRRSTDNPFENKYTTLDRILRSIGVSSLYFGTALVVVVLILGTLMATGIVQVK